MKKHIYLFMLATAALFITGCGSNEKKTIADNTPISVKVRTVGNDSDHSFLTASGTIQAVNSANLSTRIMGFVTKMPVNIGDNVKKGDLLVAINNADLQAKLAQVNAGITEATAAFTNAEKDYNRFKNLFSENSASKKEFDDMTAQYNMAKARLESAKQMKNEVDAQFTYANIRAPFSGIITGTFIKIGDLANPGVPLVSMEAGKATKISPSAKNSGGQYLVKATLDKTDVSILSGMFVTVQFPIEKQTKTDLVLIPKNALVTKGQLSGVYTISDNSTAILHWLRLGRTFGDQVEVLSGLAANEPYIISADGKLFNGVKVSIQ